MSFTFWMSFVAVASAIALSPGPSVLLVANTAGRYGRRTALLTIAGDLTANLLQMFLALFVVRSLALNNPLWLAGVQCFGVIYLSYLGITSIRNAAKAQAAIAGGAPEFQAHWRAILQGFAVAATNPKSISFFVALLPQFIDPNGVFVQQALILVATYLSIDGVCLLFYTACAPLLLRRMQPRLQKQVSGCLYLGIAAMFLMRLS